jgi:Flp pilus assembly protein TadG
MRRVRLGGARRLLTPRNADQERGQALVVFVLALTGIIAAVGLVLDGGDAFAQRRAEQNASDLAALAGANSYLVTGDGTAATTAAKASAASNGFTDGTGGVNVNVSYDFTVGVKVHVNISAPHRNNFIAFIGQGTWTISTDATALTGLPDIAYGGSPMIFSIDVFDENGNPKSQYRNSSHPFSFGDGNGDVPNDANDIAWTNYGTGNVNTQEVMAIITGDETVNKQLAFGQYIGQHNNGNHTTLFNAVDQYLSGTDLIVPIVDHNGNFQGWSTFHVVSADGGGSKTITGYFKNNYEGGNVGLGCQLGSCPRYLGTYILKLTD